MSQATLGSGPYRNSSLFSGYYLDERVADLDAWDCDAEAEEAFEQIRDLWNREGALLPSYKEDELIDTWIAEVLDILGYGTSSEVTLPDGGGYVDRLLFENKDVRRESARQALDSGTEGHFSRALSILEAKQWDADFEKFFSEQRSYRDASHQIKFYLERTPGDLNWGILTDGKKWRLYGTKDYETQTYYEVDLPEILESGNLEAFKYFYVFFRPGAFVETAGSSFLDDVWSESETAAQELGEDLQDNVFRALRVLGKGFVESNDLEIDPNDEDGLSADELKEQSLVLLYRLMFVLYAESRGLIDPDDPAASEEYQEYFSLEAKREEILDEVDGLDVESGAAFEQEFSQYSSSIWGRLSELFELIDEGEEDLGIPPYNGGLFSREDHEFLAENSVSDPAIAEVIFRLSTTENDEGEYVPADYADLDTRHLGSIYEGLLEHEFRIAPEAGMAAVAEDGGQVWKPGDEVSVADAVEVVDEGGLYVVNDEGERKATGAYYTPDYVVTYIVEETIDPLIDEIHADLEADGLSRSDGEYFRRFYDRVTDLTVLDPAMGSGHFLTKATGYLTEHVMSVVREQEIQSYDEQDIRRTISKEVIYGVDLNGMAVELAKLSMWLETLAADQPLAFLDHHLKDGNSLVGSDITEVLSDDTEENDGQLTLTQAFARVRQDTLGHVMDLMADLLAYDNDSLESVKSMEELYDEIRDDPLYTRLFELANVHTAEEFGVDVPEDAYEQMAGAIEDEADWAEIREEPWFKSAQATAAEQDFFHWELEFPEVFFDADGERMPEAGFDTVIGNPPYVRIQELQTNVPERAEYLSRYRSSEQNFDLYVNFTEKGYELLSPRGLLGFIEPHKFFQNEFGRGIREFLADNDSLDKILSFGHKQVFGNASVYTCVLILSKYDEDGLEYAEVDPADLATGKDPNFRHINPELDGDAWVFQSPEVLEIIQEIEDNPLSLADATKKIYQGIITSADSIFLVETTEQMGDLTVVENGHGEQFKVESELLHPFLKGKDVKRYAPLNPPLQIILPYRVDDNELDFIPEESLRSEFPRAFEYFKSHESKLRSRDSGSMDTERWYDFTRAQNMGEFLNDKIVTPEISYGGNFTLDETGVLHKSKVYGIVSEENIDNEYLLTLLNSKLFWFYLRSTGYVLRGGYFTFKTDYLEPFCIPSIGAASKKLNSERLVERANNLFATGNAVDSGDGPSYQEILRALAAERITQEKEQSVLNTNLTDHLGTYTNGPELGDIGFEQPPEGSTPTILQQTSDEKTNLRTGDSTIKRVSRNTVEIHLTARYKPDDEDAHETDQWGYTETEYLPAFRITDLTEREADLIEHFVPVAVDEAGGFANFRETATKTNSLIDRLKAIEVPDVDDVADDLENYLDTKERAAELDAKIEQTDRLIDEIVYELYGLTDEEIEIVEEAVED
ncbi:restriction endonuclease [Halorubrum sp. SP3]|uniref:Eco57I restriction-modification methylase domain-containing protein n=3 Tax=unclassified Halorubrum TaxID=2642239 RepID=UPI0010F80966|nr:N-6 DNA methylase [Halorubrum sp. SP3]TKX55501.1 restriction endonuclease [Halorubrum sp. SP3]